jgi:predicted amidophosphoribosyltransferase
MQPVCRLQRNEADTMDGGPVACSVCGRDLELGAAFCVHCGQPAGGAPAPQPSRLHVCVACGAQLDAGDAFCTSCGRPLGSPTPGRSVGEPPSRCPACGQPLDRQDAFCTTCGRPATSAGPGPRVTSAAGGGHGSPAAQTPQWPSRPSRGAAAPQSPVAGTHTITGWAVAGTPAPHISSGVTVDPSHPDQCPACGIALEPNERFCRSCGRLIKRARS